MATALELLEQRAMHAGALRDRAAKASPLSVDYLQHTIQMANQAELALLVAQAILEAHRTPAELAAQDMLEALRAIADETHAGTHYRDVARAAIAKAEGKSHG